MAMKTARLTFRTVFRETRNSRQICLIVFCSWKYARRIFAIVSTTRIPHRAPNDLRGIMNISVRGVSFGSRPPRYGVSFPCRFTDPTLVQLLDVLETFTPEAGNPPERWSPFAKDYLPALGIRFEG